MLGNCSGEHSSQLRLMLGLNEQQRDRIAALPELLNEGPHHRTRLARHCGCARGVEFVDGVLARRVIQPAVLDKFHEPLQGHFDTVFGPSFREQANALRSCRQADG